MIELFVAPDGQDTWSGRYSRPRNNKTDGPFATLERARDEIRLLKTDGAPPGGVTVHLAGGRYELDRPFVLEAQDSGAEEAPVIYRAARGEAVTLSGGRRLKSWSPVTDSAILSRLPEVSRDHVIRTHLTAAGITDTGEVAEAGKRIELFFEDKPMTLARWPNEGFVRVKNVVGGDKFTVHGIDGDRTGRLVYEDNRPGRWKDEPDIRLHGYWFWDWSDAVQRVVYIDHEQRVMELEQPYHHYGYRPGQRYYAMNLLCELDRPGEWYLDRDSGMLYFWPPGALTEETVMVSVLPSVVTIRNASWIRMKGLTFEGARNVAITVEDSHEVSVDDCVIRNTGSYGVAIHGGSRCGVRRSLIHQTGEGGALIEGGDRISLTPAGHHVERCHIHDFGRIYRTYRPAVRISGVGNRVAHNRIHNGPHNAIQLNGNDHIIEYNEIFDVCYETGDVGAFYMGRDWTERGVIIRYNYFHDIRGPGLHGAMAVYLDDAASGITVYGNLFVRASRAAFIGGGRDNLVENNIFVGCDPSTHVDARGLNWMKYHVEGEDGIMPQRLAAIPFKTPPWSERYPELLTLLDEDPGAPRGNRIVRNISVEGRWSYIEEAAISLVVFEDNLVDHDPGFVDAEHGDYRLKEDSPALALGFIPLPLNRIGPQAEAAHE